MTDAPDETQRGYRAAALRILEDINEAEEGLSIEVQVEALCYLAEALLDLAETLKDPVLG